LDESPDGKNFTNEQITGMLIAMLFAGQHTSSITASWSALHLAHNPRFLARVMKEQQDVIAEHGPELTFPAVEAMTFLENCIREALRMGPPLIFVMRKVMVPQTFGQRTIPAGDMLFCSPSVSGRDPNIFANPNEYDPERYDAPRSEHLKFKNGYVGFGAGVHKCLGERFALLQIRTILAFMLRTFDLHTTCPLPEPDYTALVVPPHASGCWLRYQRKTSPLPVA